MGYWGDVIHGPYFAFGTWAKDPVWFEMSNKEYQHTATEIAKQNIQVYRKHCL